MGRNNWVAYQVYIVEVLSCFSLLRKTPSGMCGMSVTMSELPDVMAFIFIYEQSNDCIFNFLYVHSLLQGVLISNKLWKADLAPAVICLTFHTSCQYFWSHIWAPVALVLEIIPVNIIFTPTCRFHAQTLISYPNFVSYPISNINYTSSVSIC